MFVRLSVAVFAGLGAQLLTRRLALTRPWLPLGVLVFALPLEHLSTPLATYRLPVGSSEPEAYSWLESLPTGTPILEYPMNPSSRTTLGVALDASVGAPLATYSRTAMGQTIRWLTSSLWISSSRRSPTSTRCDSSGALGLRYVVFHPDYERYPEVRHAARLASSVVSSPTTGISSW